MRTGAALSAQKGPVCGLVLFARSLRERSFRAGEARPKSPEFGANSGRFGLDADCSASEGAKLCEAFVWPEMARRHFSANRVSRPAAKRPGDEDRRFAARKEMHQSSDWCIFHTPLRERSFRAGESPPEKPGIRREFRAIWIRCRFVSRLRARKALRCAQRNAPVFGLVHFSHSAPREVFSGGQSPPEKPGIRREFRAIWIRCRFVSLSGRILPPGA